MKKSNKLGIALSALSVLIIGGSVYYYNGNISKSNEKIQQTTVTTTFSTTTGKKLVLNKENVKISNEVKDEKTVVITIENIADRTLTDVVVEGNYKDGKIAEVLIPTLNKGDKKKIELPLDNKLNASSINDNPALTGDFRMMEKAEFSVADSKGEILVSSLKAQEKSFYIEKIKSSSLEQKVKDELIKKVENSKDIAEIEKLLKEYKIIEELRLSGDHVVFKDGVNELKVESNSVVTTTVTQSTSTEIQETVTSEQTSAYVAPVVTAPATNNYRAPRVQVTTSVANVVDMSNDVKTIPSEEATVQGAGEGNAAPATNIVSEKPTASINS